MWVLNIDARRSGAGAQFGKAPCLVLVWAVMGLCALSSLARAQGPAATFEHERTVQAPPIPQGSHPPVWSGNASLWFQDNLTDAPLIRSFNRDGVDERLSFEIAGAAVVNIRGATGATDGSIVVAGRVFSGDMRRTGFVAVIPPDRRQRVVIQTEPFNAEVAVLAADRTIWAVGSVARGANDAERPEYSVIRRYDQSGKLLSSSTLSDVRGEPGNPLNTVELSRLVASGDRVGWFTSGCQYIEFSLDGSELGRYEPPIGPLAPTAMRIDELRGIGLSQDNRLIIGWRSSDVPAILQLNRRAGRWDTIHLSPAPPGGVLGFDGNVLVVLGHYSTLERFRVTASPAAN